MNRSEIIKSYQKERLLTKEITDEHIVTFSSLFSSKHVRQQEYVITPSGELLKNNKGWKVYGSQPSGSYQSTIAAGLRETFKLNEFEIATYFNSQLGII